MILRDPVHGLVRFQGAADRIVVELMDTPEVQRLRRIRMLGLASLAFPGAEHTRFAHAVGAAHVMQRYLARMHELGHELPPEVRIQPREAEAAMAAALLHDLGHGPFSHTFEGLGTEGQRHETWTERLLRHEGGAVHGVLASRGEGFVDEVVDLVHGRHRLAYLARAVSGTFDVDRCDYLLRDAYMTGTRYGLLDLDWLLQSLRLVPSVEGGAELAVDDEKGLAAVEGFFLARLAMYRQVYLHKAVRAAEMVLRALLARARTLAELPGPPVFIRWLRGRPLSCAEYLALDDSLLQAAVASWCEVDDPILSDLARRFRDRRLLKSLPVAGACGDGLGEKAAERAADLGFDPSYYVAEDRVEVGLLDGVDLPCVLRGGVREDLLEASQLLRELSAAPFVHHRIFVPEPVRDGLASRDG